jgi:outer membrane protein assembly factor BamB
MLLLVLPMMYAPNARASDWPQFLGPSRDAVYSGPPLAEEWPAEGPRVVWSSSAGEGYSSPVVSEGRVVLCHRVDDELLVSCFEALTGKSNWVAKFPSTFRDGVGFDSGPRPTPAIKNGRVIFCNSDGFLGCLDLKDGKKLWAHRLKSEFKSSGSWHGFVASPLVTEAAVILPVGGTNSAGVVAFDPATGKVVWSALNDKLTASSPVLATWGGKQQVIVFTRAAIRSLDPASGHENWSLPTRRQTTGDVYAAAPVVFGDYLFAGGWYKLGAQLLRIKNDRPEEIWHLDDALSTHYASAIYYDGYLYGFHGHAWERGGPTLRCIERATGKLIWEEQKVGSGTIVRTGDNLLLLLDTGELQLAKASPKGFKIKSRAQVVGKPTRSYPAIADGYVFVKGPRTLVCLDLRAAK